MEVQVGKPMPGIDDGADTRKRGGRRKKPEGNGNGTPVVRKTPRERFVELGPKRMQRAIKLVKQLGRFANKSQYDVRESERAAIIRDLKAAVQFVESRFSGSKDEGYSFRTEE